jgi:hypothetical protein
VFLTDVGGDGHVPTGGMLGNGGALPRGTGSSGVPTLELPSIKSVGNTYCLTYLA